MQPSRVSALVQHNVLYVGGPPPSRITIILACPQNPNAVHGSRTQTSYHGAAYFTGKQGGQWVIVNKVALLGLAQPLGFPKLNAGSSSRSMKLA
jgi:hypothetical protein